MTEYNLYKTKPDKRKGRRIFWRLEKVMHGYFKDIESSNYAGEDVYYEQSVYEPVIMRHSEDEIYFDVLQEVEKDARHKETLNYDPEKWGYFQFEAHAYYWDTLEDVPYTSRIWSLNGKPLDGHNAPYYIQADERQGKGWELKSVPIELAEHAISSMINHRAYDTPDDMRYSWRVVDKNGKELALELPWVEVEKQKVAELQAMRKRVEARLQAKLDAQEQETLRKDFEQAIYKQVDKEDNHDGKE